MTDRWVPLLGALVLAACSVAPDEPETIVVGGATGRQGTAVVTDLLRRGYRVRGLTRQPASPKAERLRALGVEVLAADYGDRASLDNAFADIDKVFFYSGRSANELQEGRNVIAAAQAAGVEHLIYSSGAAAEPGKGLDGPKMQIEQAIIASGVPYTIVRPVAFMENYRGQQKRIARSGITDSRAPDRLLHFVAVQDIGLVVGAAFADPATWRGRAFNLAGDRLTVAEHVEVFSRVMQQPIRYTRMPLDDYLNAMPKPLRPLFRWYDEVGYSADVAGLRARFPQLQTLEGYLRASGWEPVAE